MVNLFDICPSRDDAQQHIFNDSLVCEFCLKDIKKEYKALTEINDHTGAAVVVVDAVGTGYERMRIHTIQSHVEKYGRILPEDKEERDQIMRRFSHSLK